ncbi:ABC transporter permease [Candidatus Micrarchaeota archaeon]|nr:ABC transporter permease [Candidatus Micrarchaeota archaeon]
MKLLTIALKELKLIKTQKISLLLIFFFPIITILAIGTAFGNVNVFTGTGFTKVPVGIYIPSNANSSTDIIAELNAYQAIELTKYYSPEEVIESMKKRKSKVGIIIRQSPTAESGIDLELIFDNSSLLETQVTLFVTETVLNEISYRKSTEMIGEVLENLDTIKKTVREEITTIDSFITKLDQSYYSLNNLENRLNQIDLSTMQSQLNQFDTYYYQSKNDVSDTRTEIYNAKSQLSGYKTKIQTQRNQVVSYRDQLNNLNNQISNIIAVSPPEVDVQLYPIQNQLNNTINEMNYTINQLDQAVIDIDSTNNKLDQTLDKLNDVDSRLNSANSSIQSFKNTVSSMQNTLNEIKLMITEAKSSRESIMQDLKETKSQMQALSTKLENLSSLSPDSLVRPIKITKEPLFASTEVSVITPMAIAIVLLLTSLLLTSISIILEKNQGVELRAKLSPTMRFTWIAGKMLGQMVFALFEALIILLVAFIGFGVIVYGSALDLFLVLLIIAFSFISIGLFLTNFTKTQSTAVLSSLLVSVPLIFLSGMILPTSFMPSFVKSFSEVLPLTVATELVTSILVRGSPISFLIPQMLLLLVPAGLMVAFTLIYPRIKED